MKAESALRSKIAVALRARGARVVVVHQDGYGAGELDLDVIYLGLSIKLEVKTPENKKGATALQKKTIREVREHGGFASVVRSVEEAIGVIYYAANPNKESSWREFEKWYLTEGAGL